MSNLISEKQIFTDNLPEFVAALTNASASGVSLIENSSGVLRTLVQGANISITDNGNGTVTITSSSGYAIVVVANYSALPAANTVPSQFYWCSASQGTAWLPGSLGGTYYNSGLYYSNGVSWEFMNTAYQATQAEVDIGTVTDQFVSPATFTGASKWNNYVTSVGAASPITSSGGTTPTISTSMATNKLIGRSTAGTGVMEEIVVGNGLNLNSGILSSVTGGSGSSGVSYYLNGSVSQGTFGGNTYYEMNRTPIIGTAANFTINTNGYIAQFLTDAGDPALLNIPAGNFNCEIYMSASSGGGTPSFYLELYKYDGTNFTLIADNSVAPEGITNGTLIELYVTTLAVPQTALTLTDRLAIRIYVLNSGRTITLHTQDSTLCQIITTFTTGLAALNGLTEQVQTFAIGSTGVDFNISSLIDTHTFNLPTASATNRGLLSTTDWSTFNGKQNALGYTPVPETRNLTINGTTYNLSADRTWTISAGSSLTIKDEGSTLTTAATSIDFTGAGVTASAVGNDVTVNITGGGGGTSATSNLFAYYNFI